jgi:hypothetical protein
MVIFMEHLWSLEGACLEIVFRGVGAASFDLRFLLFSIIIQFLASFVAIELTPVTVHEKNVREK